MRNIKTVLKRTTARPRKLRATDRCIVHVIVSQQHSSPPLRCQNAITRRGVRRPSDEARRWRGYLKHDACMRSAIRLVSAASAETNEYNRNN
ncbi:hypothetical protein EVAR_11282_1 [Eumeta japonica]|uniref:Uncharacterized protein n=1 Tax=Eumeta variegata TaxID=151549 RepID=A0A4C1UM41_EUMVA|nr:hypothetical protein EVAR_11282_1 [Eumeta japonica]